MCLNFGTPKNDKLTNGKSIILGVPILKHITVCLALVMLDKTYAGAGIGFVQQNLFLAYVMLDKTTYGT